MKCLLVITFVYGMKRVCCSFSQLFFLSSSSLHLVNGPMRRPLKSCEMTKPRIDAERFWGLLCFLVNSVGVHTSCTHIFVERFDLINVIWEVAIWIQLHCCWVKINGAVVSGLVAVLITNDFFLWKHKWINAPSSTKTKQTYLRSHRRTDELIVNKKQYQLLLRAIRTAWFQCGPRGSGRTRGCIDEREKCNMLFNYSV